MDGGMDVENQEDNNMNNRLKEYLDKLIHALDTKGIKCK